MEERPEDEKPLITLFFQTLAGQTFVITDVNVKDDVAVLRNLVNARTVNMGSQCRLIFNKQRMNPGVAIEYYGVEEGSCIYVVASI